MRKFRALFCVLLVTALISAAQDTGNLVRLADRSDWWSVLNENFYWPIDKPKSEELNPETFGIAGVMLQHNDEPFRDVEAKFGRAVIAARGSSSGARQQLCYSSPSKPTVNLIFEAGESNRSFYLFNKSQPWNGDALCAESAQVTPALRTRNGLGLGMSPAEVEKILGKPDVSNPTRLVYQRQMDSHTSPEKLALLRSEHPDMSDADFHESYDSYEMELYVEARFTEGKLTYLAVSKGENF